MSVLSSARPPVLGYSELEEFVSVSETFNPECDNYVHKTLIYDGEFSRVVRCRRRSQKMKMCAIKTVQKYRNGKENLRYLRETHLLQALKGKPFIQQYLGSYSTNIYHYLVTELVRCGSLSTVLSSCSDGLSGPSALFYLSELTCALNTLHQEKIVHADVTLDNLLLDHEGHLVLCDFDKSQTFETIEPEIRHTPPLCTLPQCIDWRGFASTAWFLCTNRPLSSEALTERVLSARQKASSVFHLLKTLLKEHSSDQCGASYVMRQSYFQDVDWALVASRRLTPPVLPMDVHGQELLKTSPEDDQNDEMIALLRKLSRGFCISRIS